jgi:amino acid transporter
MLFALYRDGFLSRRLGETSPRTGAPANALAAVMLVGITTFVILRLGGVSAVNAFIYPATSGVLTLLVAYIVTNAGALRFLFLSRRVPAWEAGFPWWGCRSCSTSSTRTSTRRRTSRSTSSPTSRAPGSL